MRVPALLGIVLANLAVIVLGSCAAVNRNVEYDGFTKRLFKPSARVFFDNGKDEKDEVDLYKDGSIAASVSLIEGYWPFIDAEGTTQAQALAGGIKPRVADWSWRFGPTLGFGLTSPAGDGAEVSASGAPVALFTVGWLIELPIMKDSRSIVGIELGWARGLSADEGLDDTDDSAFYLGLTIDIPWD